MNISKLAATCGLATLLLSGCSITPEVLTPEEVEQGAAADLNTMFMDQEPVSGPITLYEAIARAVKYNLDHRLKMMEEALAQKQLDLVRYDQLPELTASAGYYSRDNFSGGTSIALTGPNKGDVSLIASTSSEKQVTDVNGILVWNVLDFGVSYVRAQQQSKEVLITEERRRNWRMLEYLGGLHIDRMETSHREELDDWNCCGASSAHSTDRRQSAILTSSL